MLSPCDFVDGVGCYLATFKGTEVSAKLTCLLLSGSSRPAKVILIETAKAEITF